MSKCFDEAKTAYGSVFSDEDIRGAVSELRESLETSSSENARIHDQLNNTAVGLRDEYERKASEDEFLFYRNLEIRNKQLLKVLQFSERKDGLNKGIKSLLSGTQTGIKGSRSSLEVKMRSGARREIGIMQKEIEDSNLSPYFNSRDHEVELADSISGKHVDNPKIRELASIINKAYDRIDHLYKRQGMFIDDLDNRVTRNFHTTSELMKTHDSIAASTAWRSSELKNNKFVDQSKVFEKAFQRWLSYIHPSIDNSLLDVDRTFNKHPDDYDKQVEFMRNSFNSLTNGGNIYDDADDLRMKLKKHRVLHFKDGESLIKYNKKFGTGSLQDSIINDLMSAHNNISILEDFGVHPRKMIKNIIKKSESIDERNKFKFYKKANLNKLLNLYDDMTGGLNDPASKISAISSRLRGWTNVTRLGSVFLQAITDLGPVSLEMGRAQGSFFKGMKTAIENLTIGKISQDKKILNSLLGVYTHQSTGEMTRFFMTDDSPGKWLTKMQRLLFKLGGMQWWDNSHRGGLSGMLSHMLAMNKHIPFDKLSDEDKHILSLYDLDDKWDMIRSAPIKLLDKREYITPDSARNISDDKVKEYLRGLGAKRITKTRINDVKRDIENNLGAYFEDRMSHAILHPDAADRQFFLRGSRSGQFWGSLARMVAQFKMYPTAFITKPLSRLIYGKGADSLWDAIVKGKGDMVGMAQLVGYVTLLGYLSNAARSISNNETPDDPTSSAALYNALRTGGGLGIYGDLIFNKYNKFGRGFLDQVTGPSINNISDGINFFSGLIHGQASGTAFKHLLKNNIPLIRLFYTKLPFDYLLNHTIGNTLEPDYYDKRIKQLQKQNKSFIFNP